MSNSTKDYLLTSKQGFSSEDNKSIKSDSEADTTMSMSDDESNNTAPNDADQSSNDEPVSSSPSSPKGPRRIPLGKALVVFATAIVVSLLAGKQYGSHRSATLPSIAVAPQCEEEGQMNTSTLSGSSSQQIKKPVFQFAKIVDEEDDDDDDDEDDDEEEGDENGVDDNNKEDNLLQFFINAHGLEEHFEDYDTNNGEEIIAEFLEDMLEASDACENMFQLYGHFAHDATKHGGKTSTLQALGMFRYGMGQVSLTAWPNEGKVMADFLIIPPRSTETETYDDDDEDEDEDDDDDDDDLNMSEENLFACVDSIAKFFYPDDIIEPNGIKGDYGNVDHLSRMGPFEVLSKHGKDPFRFTSWTDTTRSFKPFDINASDLLDQMGSSDDWTTRVLSVQSPFQRIDILDSEDDYATMPLLEYYTNPELSEGKAYMEAHPELFSPDRMLYLDGVIQSTMQGLAAYHEALVQPAMFTHPNPKRVGIVGGGECATLRETLKHNTVETVIMVEIDPVIVEVSKHYLKEWNDCSMFEGSSRYCMDDPRVEMHHLDALKWFRDRFSDEARLEGHPLYGTEEKFDVVILDALDPQNAVDFVEALYGDGAFLNSLYNSLTSDGVLLTQVGEAIYIGDLAETIPGNFNYQRSMYEKGLKNQGFEVVMNYEEGRAGFDGIWSFFAAFKDDSSRARWHMNEAQLAVEIHKRSIRRVNEENIESSELRGPFDYFDGPTMKTYRYPSKDAQVVYCTRDPKPYGCATDIKDHRHQTIMPYEPQGFDPEIPNFGADNFAVSNNRDLVSRVTVPENSYLMLEESIHAVKIPPLTSAILHSEGDIYDQAIDPVTNFISGDRDGLTIPRRGDKHSTYSVESGLLSFLNHGCGGNFNTESVHPSTLTEETADSNTLPEEGFLGRSYSNKMITDLVFDPSHTRNAHRPEVVVSSRTIPEGEAITSNYLPWYNDAGWKDHIESLQSRCGYSEGAPTHQE